MKTGEKLRFLRQFNDFSQKQMADKLNMEVRSYNNLENDRVKIDFTRIEQIVNLFGLDLSEFTKIKDTEEFKRYLLSKSQKNMEADKVGMKTDLLNDHNKFSDTDLDTVRKLAATYNEQTQVIAQIIFILNRRRLEG